MNILGDYEAHRRDEDYEIENAAHLDRQWAVAKKCPIHHVPLVIGFGIAGEPTQIFPEGKCPECFWKERAARKSAQESLWRRTTR